MWPALGILLALAQLPSKSESHVKAKLVAEPAIVEVGQPIRLRLTLEMDEGWHIYPHDFQGVGIKTEILPTAVKPLGTVAWTWPKPVMVDAFGERIPVHEGKIVVEGSIPGDAKVALGDHALEFKITYQVCSNVCLDGKDTVKTSVKIVEKGKGPPPVPAESRPVESQPVNGDVKPASRPTPGVLTEDMQPYKMAVKFEISKGSLAPGEEAVVSIHLTIEPGYHTYAPTSPEETTPLSISATGLTLVGSLEGPPPTPHVNELLKITQLEYHSDVTLKQRVRAPGTGLQGSPTVTLTGLVCDESTCLPPGTWTARFDVKALQGPAVKDAASPVKPPAKKSGKTGAALGDDSSVTTEKFGQLSLGGFLLASSLGGWASLFTPCVFPMIPITVSFFAKRSGKRRGRAVGLASAYALGIIGTFTLIGVLVALVFGATSLASFATNTWVNLGMGLLFVVLGLSLLGLFTFAAPTGLTNKLEEARGETKNDWVMTLLMAVAFTLASFTCTVPVLGALLGLSATGSVGRPIAGMLAYSATFAAPFFLLALFPSVLQKLPKGGAWLETVKISMGFVELAAALKFLSNADIGENTQILTRPLYLAIWVAIFLALAFYLFGILRMPGAEGEVGAIRAVFGVGSMSIALYLFAGIFGLKYGSFVEAFLPPPNYGGQAISSLSNGAKEESLHWFYDLDEGLLDGKTRQRRIFLNFTGDQCVNCRGMEQGMFPRPAVTAELKKMTLVELVLDRESTPDLAKRSDRYRQYQEKMFDSTARPFYVILESDGSTLVGTFAGSTNDEAKFIRFLQGND